MPLFDFTNPLAVGPVDLPHLYQLTLRMALSAALGAAIAYRFWHRFLPCTPRPSLQWAQAQTLIAAAGCLIVVVIQDNVARAFGLVGLGSFIRFRSGISDPRDAAIMFVMIGIGMSCGLGLPGMAVGAASLVAILLMILEATGKLGARRTTVIFSAEDPWILWVHIADLFPGARSLEISNNVPELAKDSGKLVVELDLKHGIDAAGISALLKTQHVPGVRRVSLME